MKDVKLATRLYVEDELGEEPVLGLGPEQAHFLRSVLRLRPGAQLALFNGRDGEWLARVEALGKGWASLKVETQSRPQEDEPELTVFFAPVKRARIDWIVEKATELGCTRLQPVLTHRTIVDRVNVQRLRTAVREAAEQCERIALPEVADPVKLERMLDDWPDDKPFLFADESGGGRPIHEIVNETGARALLTGPEGGFDEREQAMIARHPAACPVGLGPRILRADTAVIAALSVMQALGGDWAETPKFRNLQPR
ncbi:16S rRNA (uracil(1498)-N(3))-methyltransferase [Fodinicurvata fenggangensis]|uniref:16S rRNA (uracil(1498)-N(3))-methyltransferase n=1 Tax=Fodinicurvata fenggangensis TaxID=1121830 RepID=UPI00047B17E7|nr:16S rRNA (uracil(1498)-N(3))-methyltransferase [Fodinicurvata fenggangensis]